MVIFHSYVSLPEGIYTNIDCQYGMDDQGPHSSHVTWPRTVAAEVLKMPSDCSDCSGDPSRGEGWRMLTSVLMISGWNHHQKHINITRNSWVFPWVLWKSWGFWYFQGLSCLRGPRSQAAAQAPKLWIFWGKNREIWRSKISNSTEVRIWNDLYSSIAQWLDCFVRIKLGVS